SAPCGRPTCSPTWEVTTGLPSRCATSMASRFPRWPRCWDAPCTLPRHCWCGPGPPSARPMRGGSAMPEHPDPFEQLRRPMAPLAPSSSFAASLRRRLEQDTGQQVSESTATDNVTPPAQEADGTLAMVHLRVADADRAMAFFGALCGWEAERVEFDDHVSHYTLNTTVTVRLL